MEEIESLINSVNENNWREPEDNTNLIKKMLNYKYRYKQIKEMAEDEIDEQDERFIEIYNKGIEFLQNNIDNLIHFINEENKYYDIFPIVQAEKSVGFLFNKFLSEENQRVVEKIKDVLTTSIEKDENYGLWFEPFIPGQMPLLKEISQKIVGRNSKYFWEVIERISNENAENKIDLYKKRKKNICGIKNKNMEECTEFIPPEKNEYFIAYPFSNKRIKDVIIDSFKERWRNICGNENKLTPITADMRIESAGILCNICKKIHYTKFWVYVLSKQRKTDFPNPNVMLELGIAMKIGKPYILIYRKGTRNIADLAGHIRFEYNTYEELKRNIITTEKLEDYLQVEV